MPEKSLRRRRISGIHREPRDPAHRHGHIARHVEQQFLAKRALQLVQRRMDLIQTTGHQQQMCHELLARHPHVLVGRRQLLQHRQIVLVEFLRAAHQHGRHIREQYHGGIVEKDAQKHGAVAVQHDQSAGRGQQRITPRHPKSVSEMEEKKINFIMKNIKTNG